MQRFFHTLGIALLSFLFIGLSVWVWKHGDMQSLWKAPPLKKGRALFSPQSLDKTTQVTFFYPATQESAQVTIADNIWKIKGEWSDRASPPLMHLLFQEVLALRVVHALPLKNEELELFGLGKNAFQITFSNKEKKTIATLFIGKSAAQKILHLPQKSASLSNEKSTLIPTIFVRLANASYVYLCQSPQLAKCVALLTQKTPQKTPFYALYDSHPLYWSPLYLQSLTLTSPQSSLKLEQLAQGKWMITKPLKLATSRQALKQFFTQLAKLSSPSLIKADQYPLPKKSFYTIDLQFFNQEQSIHLSFYPSQDPNTLLARVSNRPNTLFSFPKQTILELFPSLNTLRFQSLLALDGKQLSTIVIRPHQAPPTLLKRDQQSLWRILLPSGWHHANTSTLLSLIMALTQTPVEHFISDAATDFTPYGLDKPFLHIACVNFNKNSKVIALGRGKDNMIYAHQVGSPHIVALNKEQSLLLHPSLYAWLTPEVWHVNAIDVLSIQRETQQASPLFLSYHYLSESWKATKSKQDLTESLDPIKANQFLKKLCNLHATHWLAPTHSQALNILATPHTTITIQTKEPDEQGNQILERKYMLQLAAAPGNLLFFGRFFQIPSEENNLKLATPFLLSKEDYASLIAPLLDPLP